MLVVFDLDGTLVDSAPDLVDALNVVLREAGRADVSLSVGRDMIGAGARRLIQRGFAATGDPLDEAGAEALTARFLTIYGADPLRRTRPFPGLDGALERLAASGDRFAVCTNKALAPSRVILDGLGLSARMAAIVGGDTLAVKKPDPAPLLETIRLAGGRPEDAVMVGDSEADVGAARAAGVPSIVMRQGYTRGPAEALGADRICDAFDALPEVIASLR